MMPLPMVRSGTCQPDVCGSACCKAMMLEVNPIYRTDPDLASWVGLHGIRLVEWHGRTVATINAACSALDAAGRCALYGTPERPDLCERFPQAPADLLALDRCTYTFDGGQPDGERRRDQEHGDGPGPREADQGA